jgi:hypothetical protein
MLINTDSFQGIYRNWIVDFLAFTAIPARLPAYPADDPGKRHRFCKGSQPRGVISLTDGGNHAPDINMDRTSGGAPRRIFLNAPRFPFPQLFLIHNIRSFLLNLVITAA